MKWPGISLKTMMLAIAIFAVDFGFFCNPESLESVVNDELSERLMIAFIGLLPMANLIAFGLPGLLWLGLSRFLRRVRRTPFSIGFQVTSWASSLAVLASYMLNSEAFREAMWYLYPWLFASHCKAGYIGPPIEAPPIGFFESCWNTVMDWDGLDSCVDMIVLTVFFSLPPLLISLAGGLITRHVVRRRACNA